MELGARWILFIAHRVAAVDGAVTAIPAPPGWVLPLLTLASLWLILVKGRLRWAALLPIVATLAFWAVHPQRPLLLISGDGGLAGLMGQGGRAVSAARGAGFAAESWLENDGDLISQEDAALRPGFTGQKGARSFTINGWRAVLLTGKGAADALKGACSTHDLVIAAQDGDTAGAMPRNGTGHRAADLVGRGPGGCLLIDQVTLRRAGALSIEAGKGGALDLMPAQRGNRLWMAKDRGAEPITLTPLDRSSSTTLPVGLMTEPR